MPIWTQLVARIRNNTYTREVMCIEATSEDEADQKCRAKMRAENQEQSRPYYESECLGYILATRPGVHDLRSFP